MITERILQIIELKGITKYKFCKDLGLSNGFLDKPREISTDKYANILVYFSDVNPNWLLTGMGEIFKSKEKAIYKVTDESNKGIPLIPIDAMAGFGTGEMQIMEYECERYVVPAFKGAEFLISVKGSSMHPKYNSGDLVACRKVPLDTFFQWNKVYVLDTEQGALIKRIKKGADNKHITLVSDNVSYDPFELCLEKIYSIAIVVGVIRLE
jgi:phage repressor protein C with HTH and peptisase S24 domain